MEGGTRKERERELEGQRDSDGRDGKRALDNTSLGGRGGGERHLQPQGAIAAGRGGGGPGGKLIQGNHTP